MAISDKSVSQSAPTTIDPQFFLPPGVIDLRYVQDGDPSTDFSDDEVIDAVVDGSNIDTGDGTLPVDPIYGTDYLPAPTSMTIVSQTVKVGPDGAFTVDVIVDVEDLPGVANYEVRLSKA